MSTSIKTFSRYQEKINKSLVHIQNNLRQNLSLNHLAEVACLSPFHYHRIFTAVLGETPHHYVHRLRMEAAAFKLRYKGEQITEIALSVGYETLAAFNKGFRQHFGFSPSYYRKFLPDPASSGNGLPYTRCAEPAHISHEILTMPEQSVLFVRKTGRYEKSSVEAWSTLMNFAYGHSLLDDDTRFIGITYDAPEITPEERIRYDACITLKKSVKPAGEVGVQKLGGGRYAVFLHTGPYQSMTETYRYIYGTWLLETNEKLQDKPSFSVYRTPFNDSTAPSSEIDIYIPIH